MSRCTCIVSTTFEFLMIWIHVMLGSKVLVDDEKRMFMRDAVPVNTRRPLLSGAWSGKARKITITHLEV